MSRKIFVSYKHEDESVWPVGHNGTARDYVDKAIELFEGDEIYKGEGDEDLSKLKDETLRSHLRDKIYDSSITLVLISPEMKDDTERETDQFIPWEISFSLKETTRGSRTSKTNAILAVVLPDQNSSYSYFLEDNTCPYCHCRTFHKDRLFQILRDNMFNIKDPRYNGCPHHPDNNPVFTGYFSYIYSVKWCDFENGKEKYLKIAEEIREKINDYNLTKEVTQ